MNGLPQKANAFRRITNSLLQDTDPSHHNANALLQDTNGSLQDTNGYSARRVTTAGIQTPSARRLYRYTCTSRRSASKRADARLNS